MLSFFPLDVLNEIWDLIESVLRVSYLLFLSSYLAEQAFLKEMSDLLASFSVEHQNLKSKKEKKSSFKVGVVEAFKS